ncbi:MAG: class I SAM-dependent methyltransferase [Gammaproteobacteria bacterium]|nr:class I SAM-dependent methyltransferase [Pseudomonadales bacterium]MCP5347574.1 class I SAM-dependent methyltransferase [Pseudomonadales bacterium]
MTGFYDQDLAYVHHVGFGDFARLAGEQVLGILRRQGITGGLIIDIGCGSGIWAARLGRAGYRVLGVDISPAMLNLARKQAPDAQFELASGYEYPLPRCQAITALGESLGYGYRKLPDTALLGRFFENSASCLRRGGLLILDLIVTSDTLSLNSLGAKKGQDWAVISESTESAGSATLTRAITVFREVDGHYRRSDECHLVRLFDADQVVQLMEKAGFRVQVSEGYGDFPLATRRLAFIGELLAEVPDTAGQLEA